jgi:hypothetical protein
LDKDDFKELLLRIDDLLIDVDYWRQQIDNCKECHGWAVEDHKDMCPSCREALLKEFKALKRISSNAEMRKNMMILKKVLEDDTTGELTEIFTLSRKKRHE